MLLELQIENFALIEEVRLEFREGLNVLTGETGAGKSIVLDALGFLLGDPARDTVQKRARVWGRFLLSPEARHWLLEQGWDDEEEAVILREISPGGRSLSRLNGNLCTLGQLRQLAAMMLEIHSQHQSNSLLRPSRHLELLDRLSDHQSLLERYRSDYRRSQEIAAQLESLNLNERERNRQLEWLRFELQEIEDANLQPGEDQELSQAIRRLSATEELQQRCRNALEALGAMEFGGAQKALASLQRLDPQAGFTEQVALAESQIQEVVHGLHGYLDQLSADPQELERMQARAELLRALQRKYGSDLEAVLLYAQQAREQLLELEGAENRLEELQSIHVHLRQELQSLAQALSLSRRLQGARLEEEVQAQLSDLNLAAMRFQVVQQPAELGPQGCDQLEFYLAPNPGIPPRPLAKIASGGEMSRIMLAIIGIFAKYEPLTTLIFDEIDAGLGGRAAEAVAAKLGALSRQRQVLCVTHLAVIAAAAEQHLRVSKESDGQTTRLGVESLSGKARQAEIARMLSGDAGATSAQRLARELLKAHHP